MAKDIVIGLAGNPNSGKTSLFNALTGSRQHTGNWPGVTVEKKEGNILYKGYNIRIIDLPGTYSLSVYSEEEIITRNYILNNKPDLIVNVVDSTNIERNLYFTIQLMEIGCTTVVALNMFDELDKNGIEIDVTKLQELLGIPLVPTNAVKKQGIDKLLTQVVNVYEGTSLTHKDKLFYTDELQKHIDKLESKLVHDDGLSYPPNWIAIKLLERDQLVYSTLHERVLWVTLESDVRESIAEIISHFETEPEIVMSSARHGFIHGAIKETIKFKEIEEASITEKIDSVLLNRIFGLPIFLFFMWIVFELTFKIGKYPMRWLEITFGFISKMFISVLPSGLISSLVVDGIIAGVGGVLVFLPNILILFLAISFMEQTGYMARVAFLMDKLMHKIGLHGRSFIPMIMGFGCSVPALMACRTLKNRNDKLATMLVIPFMSCGAKLPVYLLLIGTFFSNKYAGSILFGIYLFGVLVAMLFARFFKSTILSSSGEPFVMELPPYRMPTFFNIFIHMWEKTWLYIKKAGTIILFAAVIVWFLSSYPVNKNKETNYKEKTQEIINNINLDESIKLKSLYVLNIEENKEKLKDSYVGRIGCFVEPIIKPIGFDWKIGIALIAGLSAKELVVSTLSTIYSLGDRDIGLRTILKDDKKFTFPIALSLIVFVLLYLPCFSTVIIFFKESLSIKWTSFMILYTILTAYIGSFIVYNIARIIYK